MSHKTKTEIIIYLVLSIIIGVVVWFVCSGCESQGIKDTLKNIQKSSIETKKAVDGNNNLIQEQNTSIQETNNLIDKNIQQIQKGVGVKAETIEELKSSVKNTNNSSLLMFGIIVVITATGAGLIYYLIKRTIPGLPIPTGAEWYKNVFDKPPKDKLAEVIG